MGKVAGAALKVAAPEAAVAVKAAGKAGGAGKDPRHSAPGSKAAQQRQQIEDLKARRPAEDQGDEHEDQADDDTGGGGSGGGLGSALGSMSGPATGGGFVLGLLVWAVVRSYIGVTDSTGKTIAQGPAGVRMLLAAKFLNRTPAATGGGSK